MKILHLIDERWDSGIVNYALTLAQGLAAQGHAVHVAGLPGKPALKQAASAGLKTIAVEGIRGWMSLKMNGVKEQYDIINAHTGRSHSWAVLLRNAKSRIIRTRCDARYPAKNIITPLLLCFTHRIIVPSTFMLRAYRELCPRLPSWKVVHVPQGIDVRAFPVFPEPAANDGFNVGVIGRLDPVKGHRFIISALASVRVKKPNIRVLIAGQEEKVSISALSQHAADLGMKDCVEFLGRVTSVQDVMRACHIGVIGSISSEAVARVALEWMASGRALVATRVGGIPDLIEHEKTGLLTEPAQPGSLASAILRLIDNHDLRRKLGLQARLRIEQTFSLDHFVSLTERIYRDAIEHPSY